MLLSKLFYGVLQAGAVGDGVGDVVGGGGGSLLGGVGVDGGDGGASGGVGNDGVGGVGGGVGDGVGDVVRGEFDVGFLPVCPEGVDEGVWDAEAVEALGRRAWDLGVSKEGFAGVVEEFARRSAEVQAAAVAAEAERVAGVEAELRGLWGDGYEGMMAGAVRAVRVLGGAAGLDEGALNEVLANPAVGSNGVVVRLLAQVGAMLGEGGGRGGLPGAGVGGGYGGVGGGVAEAERIMRDVSHPLHEAFMNTKHEQHGYANEVYNRLVGIV